MGRGTWRATVHGVAESDRTERLSRAQRIHTYGFPGSSVKKNLPTDVFDPWVGKIPWRRKWQPTAVFLPGESPWAEEPGGLQSMGSQRVGHD